MSYGFFGEIIIRRIKIVESWKGNLYNGPKFGVIIVDLSKGFDSLNHELLLTIFRNMV